MALKQPKTPKPRDVHPKPAAPKGRVIKEGKIIPEKR